MSMASERISFTNTLKDSGKPGSGILSPLTIASIDKKIDDGRNEHLGEHFYYFEYTKLNLSITFNDHDFQNEGKNFKVCNIDIYGNSKLKTKNNITIDSTVEEVKKAYKHEIKAGNTVYQNHDWDDPNLKFIHLGDIDGLNFIFKKDKLKIFKIKKCHFLNLIDL